MATNASKVNSLLAAQQLMAKAYNKNIEKGILTDAQKLELYKREQSYKKAAYSQPTPNRYPDHQMDGFLDRLTKRTIGQVATLPSSIGREIQNRNPWDSGLPTHLSEEQKAYSRAELERRNAPRTEEGVPTERVDNPFMGPDNKIGQQEVRFNPLTALSDALDIVAADKPDADTGFLSIVKDAATPQGAIRNVQTAIDSANNALGWQGIPMGYTVDESIDKQEKARFNQQYYNQDMIATQMADLFTLKDPSRSIENRNIISSPTNEMYKAEKIAELTQPSDSKWQGFKNELSAYNEDKSALGSLLGDMSIYAMGRGIGTSQVGVDIANVNTRLKERTMEKSGRAYITDEENERINKSTALTGVAMKLGQSNVLASTRGGGAGAVLGNALGKYVPANVSKAIATAGTVTGNAAFESAQEVAELYAEKWGTNDSVSAAEFGESAVGGLLGGAGMSGVGQVVKGVTSIPGAVSNRKVENLDDSIISDPTHPKYNPAEMIKRHGAITGQGATLETLRETKAKMEGVRDTSVQAASEAEQHLNNATKVVELKDIISNPDSTNAQVDNAAIELTKLIEETGGDIYSVEEATANYNKANSFATKAQEEYERNLSRLDTISASNNLGDIFSEDAPRQAVTESRTSINYDINEEAFNGESPDLSASSEITKAYKKLTIKDTTEDMDGLVETLTNKVSVLEKQLEQETNYQQKISEIEATIQNNETILENNEFALSNSSSLEEQSAIKENSLSIEEETNKLLNQRDVLSEKLGKLNPQIKEEIKKSKVELTRLDDKVLKLKNARLKALIGLEKQREELVGKTDAESKKKLQIIDDKIASLSTGKLSDAEAKSRKNTREYEKATKARDVQIKAKETLDAANTKLDLANKSLDAEKNKANPNKAIIKTKTRLRDKAQNAVTEAKRAFNPTELAEQTKLASDLEAGREDKKTTKPTTKPVNDEVKKAEDKVAKLTEDLRVLKEEDSNFNDDVKEQVISMTEAKLTKAQSELEAAIEAEAETTEQENLDAETQKSLETSSFLERSLNMMIDSGEVMGVTVTPELKLILLDIARKLSDATAAENLLKGIDAVSNDIFVGSIKYKGLDMYEAAIATAIRTKDKKAFTKSLSNLKTFMEGHKDKAAVSLEAKEIFDKTNNEQLVYKSAVAGEGWKLKASSLFSKAKLSVMRNKTGSLLIYEQSEKLVERMQEEAKIIEDKYLALEALVKAIDKPPVSTSSTNTNTPFEATEALEKELGIFITNPVGFTNNTKLADLEAARKLPNTDNKTKGEITDVTNKVNEDQVDKIKAHVLAWVKDIAAKYKAKTGNRFNTDKLLRDIQAVAKSANKSIAFGTDNQSDENVNSNWEALFNEDFSGTTNGLTYGTTKVKYNSTDVVAIIRNESDDTVELARARKKEIDAAIKAEVTFVLPSYATSSLTKLNAIKGYLLANGYEVSKVTTKVKGLDTEVETYTKKDKDTGKDPEGSDTTSNTLILTRTGNYTAKDQLKANEANSFIGFANEGSTKQYQEDAITQGIPYNENIVASKTTVAFVSVNGKGRLTPGNLKKTLAEIKRILDAGGKVILDNNANRDRPYNIGEQKVQKELAENYDVIEGDNFNTFTAKKQVTPIDDEFIEEQSGLLDLDNNKLTQRDTPLNAQYNMFSKYIATKDYEALSKLLGFEISADNKKQLDAFIRLHKQISDRVSKALKSPDSKASIQANPLYQELVTEASEGVYTLPENVITAMTLSLFQYHQINGRNSYLDEKGWRATHALQDYMKISKPVAFGLSKLGSHRAYVFQELGKGAVRALGLGTGMEAEFTYKEDLEASLGSLIFTIVNQNADKPMFKVTKSTKQEQFATLASGMPLYQAKQWLTGEGKGNISKEMAGTTLDRDKVLETKSIEALVKLIREAKPRGPDSILNKTVYFARADIENVWDSKTKTVTSTINPLIEDIIESSVKEKGGKDILDSLFNTEYERLEPLNTKPEVFSQEQVLKGTTTISENMREALLTQSQYEWKLQEGKSGLMIKLYDNNREGFYSLMGIKTDEEIGLEHPSLRAESLMNKRIAIDLYDKQIAWLKAREANTSFWQNPIVWVNQRVGYESTLFNAQTNMFARMLSSMKGWETTVDTNEAFIVDGKVTIHGKFIMALAENMEGAGASMDFTDLGYRGNVKTVDKVKPSDFIERFVNYLENSPLIDNALDLIWDMQDNDGAISSNGIKVLKETIAELDMAELSLGALIEYASYKRAKIEGKSHSTQMGTQSDGITNGPMITKFLLAAANPTTKKRGGILSNTDVNKAGLNNFYDTKALGETDLYEDMGQNMENTLEVYVPTTSSINVALDAVKTVDDKFGSRNWAKKLLTPFNYGAALTRLMNAISANVVSQLEDSYYAIYAEQDAKAKSEKLTKFNLQLLDISKAFNTVFVHTNITEANLSEQLDYLVYIHNSTAKENKRVDVQLDTEAKLERLLVVNRSSNPKNVLQTLNYLSSTRIRTGNAKIDFKELTLADLEDNLDTKYTDALEQLSNITYGMAAVNTVETYEADYIIKRDMLQKFATDAFKNYELIRKVYTRIIAKDINHITKKEQQIIDKMLNKNKAAVPSAMSNMNRTPEGKRKPGAFRSGIDLEKTMFTVSESKSIPFNVLNRTREDDATIDYSYGYMYKTMGEPGLRTLALMIQSLDSAVSIQALAAFAGMNFHDANVFSLSQVEDGVRAQNEAFYNAVISYEPSVELAQAMMRPLYEMKAMIEDADLNEEDAKAILRHLVNKEDTLDADIVNIEALYNIEIQKLEDSIANDNVVHQYGGWGGEYKITNEQRRAMRERINELHKEKDKAVKTYIKFITDLTKVPDSVKNPKSLTDLLYEEIAGLSNESKRELITKVASNKNTSLNNLIDFMVLALKANKAAIPSELLNTLNTLKDVNLSNVKIALVSKKFRNNGIESLDGTSVRFSKFNNTININTDAELNIQDLLKEMYVATMHHNLKAIKNGSMNNKELTEKYRGLKVIASNIINILATAANNKSITLAEYEKLTSIFNKKSNKNNVESLMYSVIYNPEIAAIFDKITDEDVNTANKSVLQKIKDFITLLLGNSIISDVVLKSSKELEDGIKTLRSTESINKMINKSLESHILPLVPINGDDNVEHYDSRLQLELRKLKIQSTNENKTIDIKDVLQLLESTATSMEVNGDEGYHSLLKPVIQMLNKFANKNLEVVLVDSFTDYYAEGLIEDYRDMQELEGMALSGSVFHMGHDVNKVFILSSNISSTTSGSRMSIIVHELLHGLTASVLQIPTAKQTPENNKAIKEIHDLRELIKEYIKVNNIPFNYAIDYALNGDVAREGLDYKVDEFVVQILSSKAVRDLLAKVVVDSTKRKTSKANESLTEAYDLIQNILDVDTKTPNALRNFSVIFGNMFEDFKTTETMGEYQPTIMTNEFVGIAAGLEVLSIEDTDNRMAQELEDFNQGIVGPALNNIVSAINNSTEINKYEATTDGKYPTALENPVQFTVDLIAEATEVLEADKAVKHNKNMYGGTDRNEVHAPAAIAGFLAKHTTRDNSYLNNIIDKIVNPLMDKIPKSLVEGYDLEKVWHDAIVSGKDVYSTKANDAGFNLDKQQSYVLEVLEAALLAGIDVVNNNPAFRQLEKAYRDAKNKLSVQDFHNGKWSEATPEEQELAGNKYNFIFSPAVGSPTGKSDYLSNFMSMALVSPEVQKILNINSKKVKDNPTWFEKLVGIFTSIMDYFDSSSANFKPSDSINNKVFDLTVNLAEIYYKSLDTVVNDERGFISRTEDRITDLSEDAVEALRKAGITALNSPLVPDTGLTRITVKALEGKLSNFELMANTLMDFISPNKTIGNVRETINETLGTLDNPEHRDTTEVMRITKTIEAGRGNLIDSMARAINESFSSENQDLSNESNIGITNTMLRTDLQVLTDDFNFNEIVNLINSPEALKTEISSYENEIKNLPNGKEFLNRAKDLAVYMVHRKSVSTLLAKNSLAIVNRVGLATETNADNNESTIQTLDKLISLYALEMVKPEHKQAFNRVLTKEASNTNNINGLEYMLRSHRSAVLTSKSLFSENPYSVVKGYLPIILNPTKGFEVVDESDVKLYESLGYKRTSELAQSSLDSIRGTKVMMTVSNNGKQRMVSGAISLEDTNKSGTVVVRKGEAAFNSLLAKSKRDAIISNNAVDNKRDLSKNNLIPSYDAQGEVISFSYEMSHVGLDNHLERNNTASTLLSQLEGGNIGKKIFPKQNKRTVDYLIKQYSEATSKDKNKYVLVSPDSTSKSVREKWASLPKEMQMYIREQNGENGIYMRNDEMNLLFGFRKFNPGDAFDKEVLDRNIMEAIYTGLLSSIPGIGSKAQLINNQVLGFWLEIIRTMKDYIVVRGIKVLWANIKSNIAFLMLNAADPINAFKDTKEALIYSLQYQKDMHELTVLKHELRIGLSDSKKLSRFVELQDTIARNPLKDFIQAGMMPLIVNDVSFKRGETTYRTSVDVIKENTLGRLPKPVQKGLDYLLVAQGTPLYSFLSNATQQSDFVFKYALYKQEIRKGASTKDAMALARQVFIEYDIPTNKAVQFVNDIGLWMFTKFALRIQRVLMFYARTKPGKLLLEHVVSAGIMNNPSLLGLNLANTLTSSSPAIGMPGGDVITMAENALPLQVLAKIF